VAATRARDLLILGTADVVNKRGGGPSSFLYEMFGDDLGVAADLTRAKIAGVESRAGRRHEPRERCSFSQLAYYLQCPMRYKLAVVYGLQVPWLAPVDFGANVHRALEAIHQRALAGQIPGEEDVAAIVAESWISNRRTQPEREAEYRAAAVRQLRRYLREHGESLARAVRAETAFSFALAGRVLVGKIDLLRQVEEGGLEVVDFKTSAAVPIQAERIDLQLDLYALGTQASLGQAVARQSVHFLGDGQVETWAWSEERDAAAQARLVEVLERIAGGDFSPQTDYCPRCEEFRAICPYAPDESSQA
jgi:DNA helicase-2/ATP-dependent DNA helicase PcrA